MLWHEAKDGRKAFFRLWGPLAFVLWIALACTSVHQIPEPKDWQCDPEADDAVEREDWHAARIAHEQIVSKSPNNCLAIYHLGYIWGQLGDREQEVSYYEKAVACGYGEDDRLFFNLGMAYGDTGHMNEALRAFEQAVKINPDNAENYFGLGLTAQAAGQQQRAVQAFGRAVTIDPRHWDAHLALVHIYLDQSRWADARLHLEIVQQGAPDNEELHELLQLLESRQASEY